MGQQASARVPLKAGEARAEPLQTIGRLHYEGGGDWYANPSSLPNLLAAVRARTGIPVEREERTVTLTSDELWSVPYIYMTGHGNVHFSDDELRILRRIYRRAASCMSTTTTAWTVLDPARARAALSRPGARRGAARSSRSITSSTKFREAFPRSTSTTASRRRDSASFSNGRLVVYYSYQSDLGDGWEDPEVHKDPPEKHEAALRMGVNLYAYAVGFGG